VIRFKSAGAALSVGAIALAAAACGSGGGSGSGSGATSTTAAKLAASPKTTAQTELGSLAASRTVQLTLSIKSASIPATSTSVVKNERQLVEGFRLVINESADANTALNKAGSKTGTEVDVDYGTTALAKFIVLDAKHAYVYVNAHGASALPLTLSAADQQEVSGTMAILGGKWFELPDSLLKAAAAKAKTATTTPSGATATTTLNEQQALADVQEVESALLKSSTVKSVPGGVQISGSLAKLESGVLPTIAKIGASVGTKVPTTVPAKTATGTYVATVSGNGSTLTGLTIGITTPSGSGSMTLGVAHANVIVAAPASSTPLPPSLLQELTGAAGSGI
jgi:hypothetical protein